MKIVRLLYLGYYLKELNKSKFTKYIDYLVSKTDKSKWNFYISILYDSLRFNISILEYFEFRFFEKSKKEKAMWAGTGTMYEYQKIMNPPRFRTILDDKVLFKENYQEFLVNKPFTVTELEHKPRYIKALKSSSQIVLKESRGKCGLGTHFLSSDNPAILDLVSYMQREGYDLAEPYIQQHSDLQRLSPSGVNTVRIITQLNARDEVEILGCRQRISVDSHVDNLAAGNLAAPIDEVTGVVTGPAVYSDITKSPQATHPITEVDIVGFKAPFWKECLDLAKKAALLHKGNRSIGWDIVVTENGPGLIEGNHDWCKLVWQLPVNKGLKAMLEKTLFEYKQKIIEKNN